MSEPQLRLLDISGLVARLNSAIAECEGPISLGEFTERTPRKNPFAGRWKDIRTASLGKYSLTQNVNGRGLWGLADVESERNLGYIFVETGDTDASSDNGGTYEALKLRIKYPLHLNDGQVIPNSSTKILKAKDEVEYSSPEIVYHVRKAGLFLVQKDLSKVLPTTWFLGRNLSDYELRTANPTK